jgi:hypothetical protein
MILSEKLHGALIIHQNNKFNIIILFVILVYMKRVKFNDVVEVRYFYKDKPLINNKINFNTTICYSKVSLILFGFLILILMFNINKHY